jgi:PAS domain S-box-containing protein
MANSFLQQTKKGKQIPSQMQEDNMARLMVIIDSAMDAIITVDADQHILLYNQAASKMFGYTAEEILGSPLNILIPTRFRNPHKGHIRIFGDTGITNRTMGKLDTIYGLRANGEEFPIEASISQVDTSEGKLYSVILRDVTDRKIAAEKLQESEQYLRATFEQAAVGISHIAVDGHWIRSNQKLCDITGYSYQELAALPWNNILHPDDLNVDIELQNSLLEGKMQSFNREKRLIKKGGEIVWVNVTVSLVRDIHQQPKYFIKIYEDITRRKADELALRQKNDEIKAMTAQLWQTAKLATMGELAASIAHELNNPLAILSLRIESLMAQFQPDSAEMHELKIVAQEADRMANLVGNLLQFSRSNNRQISSLDVADEITRTLELVQSYLNHRHITVDWQIAPALPLVQADRQQLRQLFLNLFTNAADAMSSGGTLSISILPMPAEQMLEITVHDTGAGIPPEILSRVTEPFFTTKGDGKGTGLGLAICRRICEEHHGTFEISSRGVGLGTTVIVKLPSNNRSQPAFIEE